MLSPHYIEFITPATLFIFHISNEREGWNLMTEIYTRGDIEFKCKVLQGVVHPCKGYKYTARIYCLQRMNQCMVDMLNEEFSTYDGYVGYVPLTAEILNDYDYAYLLRLDDEEKELVAELPN